MSVYNVKENKGKKRSDTQTDKRICKFIYDIIIENYSPTKILDPCCGDKRLTELFDCEIINYEIKEKKDFLYQVNNRIPKKPSTSIIEMHFTFCYSRPQSHYRTKNKQKILKDNMPYYKRSTPDIDNLCKFYMDCFGGHFYVNDSQIASISAIKVYGEEDFVHIKIFYTK